MPFAGEAKPEDIGLYIPTTMNRNLISNISLMENVKITTVTDTSHFTGRNRLFGLRGVRVTVRRLTGEIIVHVKGANTDDVNQKRRHIKDELAKMGAKGDPMSCLWVSDKKISTEKEPKLKAYLTYPDNKTTRQALLIERPVVKYLIHLNGKCLNKKRS